MATITAAPRNESGYSMLTVTATTAETITAIRRTDANGLTEVRALSGYFPRTGSFELTDYEAVISGPVLYTLLGSAGALATARATPAGTLPWISAPVYPNQAVRLSTVDDYRAVRASQTVLHTIPGRQDPLGAVGPLAARSGRLRAVSETYAAATALEEVLALPNTLLYRQAEYPGMDMYFLASAVETTTQDGAWLTELSYQEVTRPAAPRNPAEVWTYADLKAAYSSYALVSASFPTYAAARAKDPYLPGEVR